MAFVWLNGNFIDESDASVSLRDTGLLHAAGVFTTMRADAGRVFRLDQHLERLRNSCNALSVPLQHRDEALVAAVDELLKRNELRDARLRLTVTRGTVSTGSRAARATSPATASTATPAATLPARPPRVARRPLSPCKPPACASRACASARSNRPGEGSGTGSRASSASSSASATGSSASWRLSRGIM